MPVLADSTAATQRQLLVVSLIDSVGSGLFAAGSALFFTLYVGLSAAQVGSGLGLAAACGLLATLPLGRLADQFDAIGLLAVLLAVRGVLSLGYALVDNVGSFLVVAAALGFCERPTGPITQAVVAQVMVGERRLSSLARMRVVRNVGLGVGSVLTGWGLFVVGRATFPAVLAANSLSFLVSAVLLWRLRSRMGASTRSRVRTRRLAAVRDRPFMFAAACNGVLCLHLTVLTSGISLWVVAEGLQPAAVAAVALAANTVLCVVLQIPLGRAVRDARTTARYAKAAAGALAVGGVLLAATAGGSPVVVTVLVLLAVVALSLGEIWQSTTAWYVANEMSPAGQEGQYIAAFSLGNSFQMVVGPLLIGAVLVPLGPAGWIAFAVLVSVTAFVYPLLIGRLARRVPPEETG